MRRATSSVPAAREQGKRNRSLLGEAPRTWSERKFGRIAEVTLGKMLSSQRSEPDDASLQPYLRAGNIQPSGVDLAEVKSMLFTPRERDWYALRSGDLVIVEGGAGYGRSDVLRADLSGWGFQNHVIRVRADNQNSNRFLDYAIKALLACGAIEMLSDHATIPSFSSDRLSSLILACPPLAEQSAIADYLDRETSQIDGLIGKQEQLIDVLGERRSAMITHAITRGLDTDPDTRDSGVEWLGAIPSTWAVKKLKYLGRASIGLTYAPADVVGQEDGGTLVLRSGNVQGGKIDLEDNVYVMSQIPPDLRLRAGDILICARNGSARLIGKNAVIPEALAGSTWGAFMTVLRSPINPFLQWVLNSSIFRQQLGLFATSTINQLTNATLHGFDLPVPPVDEQRRIIRHLNNETAKIDALIDKAKAMNVVLRERRSALISAAVTGKIDVTERIEGAA